VVGEEEGGKKKMVKKKLKKKDVKNRNNWLKIQVGVNTGLSHQW